MSVEKKEPERLTPEAKKFIDLYLKSKLIRIAVVLGIVNIGALLGIYSAVVDTVAKNAAESAIKSTENKLKGLTKQFDQLSNRTTNGLATVLVSVGEAKAKTEAINQDILYLKGLDLKNVSQVAELLENSIDEIKSLVESADIYKSSTKKIEDAKELIYTNKGNIDKSQQELSLIDDKIDGQISRLSQLEEKLGKTNKWVLYSFQSAAKHKIWRKGKDEEVHIGWQQDHMDSFHIVEKDLK